jgi:hypothetical protein
LCAIPVPYHGQWGRHRIGPEPNHAICRKPRKP